MKSETSKWGRISSSQMRWIGISLAAVYWLMESVLDSLFFDRPYFVFVPGDWNEWWMRTLTATLFIAFGIYAGTVTARLERAREEQETIQQRLETTLSHVLGGFLSICAQCKRIRDDRGNWVAVETYVQGHTEAHFTHSVCPDCFKVLYPDQPFYPDQTRTP